MRKLIKTGEDGSQWAIPSDQDILDLLEISDPDGLQPEVEVKQGVIQVTPIGGQIADPEIADAVKARAAFEASLVRINDRFASALQRREFRFQASGRGQAERPIVSYELGKPEEFFYRQARDWGVELPAGEMDSFIPVLERLIAPYRDVVELRPGDLLDESAEDLGPVEICFLDVLKTDAVTEHAVNIFFAQLEPGSLVVHQDYFFDQLPMIKVVQEALADHFDYLGEVRSSALFRLNRKIEMPRAGSHGYGLSAEDQLACHAIAEARTTDRQRAYLMRLSRAHLLARHGRVQEAEATLADADRDYADDVMQGTSGYRAGFGGRVETLKREIESSRNVASA